MKDKQNYLYYKKYANDIENFLFVTVRLNKLSFNSELVS